MNSPGASMLRCLLSLVFLWAFSSPLCAQSVGGPNASSEGPIEPPRKPVIEPRIQTTTNWFARSISPAPSAIGEVTKAFLTPEHLSGQAATRTDMIIPRLSSEGLAGLSREILTKELGEAESAPQVTSNGNGGFHWASALKQSLLFLGVARTRLIAFPLFLAIFALPIPLGMTETIHLVLRKVAIAGASAVLPLLGITVFSEGTTLHTVRGSLEVADACSGFSTLYAAMAVAFLTAYTAATTARRALVLLLAAPIAIASNVLRVIILVGLVVWQGQPILETFVHPLSGMMTFALSLPIIFWLGGPPAPRTTAP